MIRADTSGNRSGKEMWNEPKTRTRIVRALRGLADKIEGGVDLTQLDFRAVEDMTMLAYMFRAAWGRAKAETMRQDLTEALLNVVWPPASEVRALHHPNEQFDLATSEGKQAFVKWANLKLRDERLFITQPETGDVCVLV